MQTIRNSLDVCPYINSISIDNWFSQRVDQKLIIQYTWLNFSLWPKNDSFYWGESLNNSHKVLEQGWSFVSMYPYFVVAFFSSLLVVQILSLTTPTFLGACQPQSSILMQMCYHAKLRHIIIQKKGCDYHCFVGLKVSMSW